MYCVLDYLLFENKKMREVFILMKYPKYALPELNFPSFGYSLCPVTNIF